MFWHGDLDFWPMTFKWQSNWGLISTNKCSKFENNPVGVSCSRHLHQKQYRQKCTKIGPNSKFWQKQNQCVLPCKQITQITTSSDAVTLTAFTNDFEKSINLLLFSVDSRFVPSQWEAAFITTSLFDWTQIDSPDHHPLGVQNLRMTHPVPFELLHSHHLNMAPANDAQQVALT